MPGLSSPGAQDGGSDDDDSCSGRDCTEEAGATVSTGAVDETAGVNELSLSRGRDARFGEERFVVMGAP